VYKELSPFARTVLMTTERWQRARQVFEQALETQPESRAALLDEICGGDAELRAEVESLLRHHGRLDDHFLEPPGVRLCLEPERSELWAESLIGRKIGRYAVSRLIGHGGMGGVFEARQEQPARTVALKVLRPGFSAPSALARFRLEPELLGRLQHPNIAQVFEAGVHEDAQGALPYFAMEFVADAQSLFEYADAHGLTARRRLELFIKVCDAVHHGHQKGIIHRDIKPANVLVSAGGEPKVIDFGVARASDADIMLATQCTQVGDLIGTVHYMSPEQCDGIPGSIDARSDIYSLGVVLYELLTHATPYDTSETALYGAMRAIKEEAPRRPSTLNRALRGSLDAILLKSLAKDPTHRYSAAAELAADLQRHLRGQPVEAESPTRWQRLMFWMAQRPRFAAIASSAVVSALVLTGTVVATRAYVSYYFKEPISIECDYEHGGAPEALLLNRKGVSMHKWRAGAIGRVVATLLQPYSDNPERKLALVGFSPGSLPDRARQIRAYDVRGDLNQPLWTWTVRPEDVPQRFRDEGITADQFGPAQFWAFDMVPESRGPRVDEVVCEFAHNKYSLRAMCVFRIDGQPIHIFWHDGGIFGCYWMAEPGLLICSGENWEQFPHERGCPSSTPGAASLLVVFALRPSWGDTNPRLVGAAGANAAGELVWYRWLGVCPIPNTSWGWTLVRPTSGDFSSVVELNLRILTDPPCGMAWQIDANGNSVEGTLVAPAYTMVRNQRPDLPRIDEFHLQDVPPGE